MPSLKSGDVIGKYTVTRSVGSGSFGEAVLVKDNLGKEKVVKYVNLKSLSPKNREGAMMEVRLLAELSDHPFVVRYHEAFVLNTTLVVVMDYCSKGDLQRQITRKQKYNEFLTEEQVTHYFVQILVALHHMHSKNILHRDLKLGNILLTEDKRIKVSDFGISKQLQTTAELAKTQIGTPCAMSPEIFKNKPYSYPADIWALGCILFELIALREPFVGASMVSLSKSILNDPVPSLSKTGISSPLCELCYSMLQKDPSKRPTTSQLMKSPVIQVALTKLLKKL